MTAKELERHLSRNYFTISGCAEFYGCTRQHVHNLINKNILLCIQPFRGDTFIDKNEAKKKKAYLTNKQFNIIK